ncbi:MAG: M24 family metallopeptidase, partial [Candidatus Micrarchaeota archaeon]|nr:M24 family metallopeptidase [Candidatus Micrarchaeota archaeon]
ILYVSRSGDATLFTSRMNEAQCRHLCGRWADVRVFGGLKEVREAVGLRKCLIDAAYIPYPVYRRLRTRGARAAGKQLLSLREVKDTHEIALMRAARDAAVSLVETERVHGRHENDVALSLRVRALKKGLDISFGTIVASHRNARFPHHIPGKAVIHGYALVDFGAKNNGYCSDITRCVGALGKLEARYAALQHAMLEVADAAYAGRGIGEFVHEVENKILPRNGIGKMPHGICHGIGLEVHELPWAGEKAKGELKENSVIAIEPAEYTASYGLRHEDMFVVGKKGARRI